MVERNPIAVMVNFIHTIQGTVIDKGKFESNKDGHLFNSHLI